MNATFCNNLTCRNGTNPSNSGSYSVLPTILIVGSIAGFIPNVVMIVGIHKKKTLQKPTYYLIANLAVCDLMLSFTTLLNMIIPAITTQVYTSRIAHTIMCKLLATFPAYWSYTASVQTLIIISAERYQAIFRPLNKLTAKRAKALCIFAWGISFVISFPIIITTQSVDRNGSQFSCIEYMPYSVWITIIYMILFVFQFALPAVVMIVLYSLILRQLRKRSVAGQNESSRSKILKRKSIYMVLVTTVIFFIFSSPWAISLAIIAMLGNNLASELAKNPTLAAVLWISRFTLPFTAIYNPIVYCIFNQPIRHLFFPCCNTATSKIDIVDNNVISNVKIASTTSNLVDLTATKDFSKLIKQDTVTSMAE